MNRRAVIVGSATLSLVGVSGCTFGRSEYREVSIQNQTSGQYTGFVEVTSSYDNAPGNTEYFAEEFSVDEHEQLTYEDAIAVSDGPPQTIYVKVFSENSVLHIEGSYEFPDERLTISFLGTDDVTVDVDR